MVGARDRADARKRLKALWDDLMIAALPFVPSAVTDNVPLWYVPHFYTFQPTLTTSYNTHPLLGTLSSHVDFTALNASYNDFRDHRGRRRERRAEAIRQSRRRRDQRHRDRAAPRAGERQPAAAISWTDIGAGTDVRHYWDGGIVDNTPLGDAIDALSGSADVTRLLVIMNLFPLAAKLPGSFAEVNDRVNQLRFGNRLRQDNSTADQINDLIETIEAISRLVPGGLPAGLAAKASKYKRVETVEISFSSRRRHMKTRTAFAIFPTTASRVRRTAGREIALKTLRPIFNLKATA